MISSKKYIFVILFFLLVVSVSCKKEVVMRVATVTVKDNANKPVSNTKVTVYVNGNYANTYVDPVDYGDEIKEVVHYTNSSGVTSFEFERDCVFEAKAEKDYVDSMKMGSATLVFKEEKNDYEATIIIR